MELGPLQQLILAIVWEKGEVSTPDLVSAVNAASDEEFGYNSVNNSAEILRRKGLLRRRTVGRVGLYRPGKLRDEFVSETWAEALRQGIKEFGAPVGSNLVDAVEMADPEALRELLDELRKRGYIKG